jgi:predicted Fe-S protein YdhL (DUF1289 family)
MTVQCIVICPIGARTECRGCTGQADEDLVRWPEDEPHGREKNKRTKEKYIPQVLQGK